MLRFRLRQREVHPEMMDDQHLPAQEHHRALIGLARINRFTRNAAALWPSIATIARKLNRPIRVLDVATGSGDIPKSLHDRAMRASLPISFSGCDLSPVAIETARQGSTLHWFVHDVIRDPLPEKYDIVMSSLFLHHLGEADAVVLLQRMASAGQYVLVNDLARSPVNYTLVWLATRLLSRSPVVHTDGPLSVRAAFTRSEVQTLAQQAGLSGANVRPVFPCRFLLTWCQP